MDVDRDVILEFESSPRLPPSPIMEWSDIQPTRFSPQLPAAQYMFSSRDTRDESDSEHFQHLSHVSTGSDEFPNSAIQSSPQISPPFLPLQPTFQGLASSDSADQVRGIHETHPVKDIPVVAPMTDLPLDFLADPDPWTTIGRILQVERLQATSHISSPNEQLIEFTKGREGVGHPSQAEINVSSSVSMDTVPDTPAKERGVESMKLSEDSSRSPPGTASSVGSVRKPLQAALAHDLNTVDGGVELSQPTYGVGARTIGGRSSNGFEYRTSGASPGEGWDVVYDGPCLFADSDPEDE